MGLPITGAFTSGRQLVESFFHSSTPHGGGHGGHGGKPLSGGEIMLILITISTIVKVVNFHYLKLPGPVSMAAAAIFLTFILNVASHLPLLDISIFKNHFSKFLKTFPEIVLHNLLGFLLFAAAVEVRKNMLERIWTTVIALSVFATAISTLLTACLTYLLMQTVAPMAFGYCLLFGAIVSPTDPVTVISIVHEEPGLLPKSLEYFVLGESLLNDAVGVVLYYVFKDIVTNPSITYNEVVEMLLQKVAVECIGGAVIGILLAWIAYSAIKSVKDPLIQVLISFVLVGNINLICTKLHASIPLASVFAGLFLGNYGLEFAIEEEHHEMFKEVWKLADETLNSLLFLMIGAAELFWNPLPLGLFRILVTTVSIVCISLFARAVSIALPLGTVELIEKFTGRRLRHPSVKYRYGTLAVLTWAGMRGGISIALALDIPHAFVEHAVPGHLTPAQLIFFMTFIIVVFSIIVQGMYFKTVVEMITGVSHHLTRKLGISGGLSTFVSTHDLSKHPKKKKNYEDKTKSLIVRPSFNDAHDDDSWFDGGGLNNILPLPEEIPQFEKVPYKSNSKIQMPRSRSFMDKPTTAAPNRKNRVQGSETFSNLKELEEPITVNDFLVEGTKRFKSFLNSQYEKKSNNYPLRRSRTSPHNVRFESSETTGNMSLRSALANQREL